MARLLLPFLLLAACTGTKVADDTSGSGDTDTDTDTDTAPACSVLDSGDDWAFNGECPQMRTPCEITVTDCSLEIGYSSGMSMDMPTAGTIEGDTITFDDNGVSGCVGTIESADSVTGTCDGGCTFTLRR
jgi:hypothetical protein